MAERGAQPCITLEMLSQARFLSGVRGLMGNLAQRLGFDEASAGQISLAVDEALCNIINHGYDRRPDGRIWIRIWTPEGEGAGLRIVIEDRARQVDPESIQPRDLADIRPGGLGVFIIREVMDEARYERRAGGGMRLTLVKLLPAGRCHASEQEDAEAQPAAIEDRQ